MWARRPQPGRACDADADSTVSSPCGAGRAGVALATARERGSGLRVVWSRRVSGVAFPFASHAVGGRVTPRAGETTRTPGINVGNSYLQGILYSFIVRRRFLRIAGFRVVPTPEKATRSVGFTSRSRFTYTVHGAVRLRVSLRLSGVYTHTTTHRTGARRHGLLRARGGARADRETADAVPSVAGAASLGPGPGAAHTLPLPQLAALDIRDSNRRGQTPVRVRRPAPGARCAQGCFAGAHTVQVLHPSRSTYQLTRRSISQRTIDALATRPISHAVPHTSTHKTH